MNNDAYFLILTLFAGIGMGFFYFGGLWLTVRRIHNARGRALLIIGSFIVRNTVCAIILWFLARGGHWQRVLICLLGFIITRTLLVRRLRPHQEAANLNEER